MVLFEKGPDRLHPLLDPRQRFIIVLSFQLLQRPGLGPVHQHKRPELLRRGPILLLFRIIPDQIHHAQIVTGIPRHRLVFAQLKKTDPSLIKLHGLAV